MISYLRWNWSHLDEIRFEDAKSYRQTANINAKKPFTTPYKDDIRKLADIKQQMSQKVILLRSTVTFWRCVAK